MKTPERPLGLYIHIPFCKSLCSFCPYCKVRYEQTLFDRYLEALIREIHLVGSHFPGKKQVTSLNMLLDFGMNAVEINGSV